MTLEAEPVSPGEALSGKLSGKLGVPLPGPFEHNYVGKTMKLD